MVGKSTNLCIRIDAELKRQAEELFSELGMNLTTAFTVFVRQAIREGGIPFEVTLDPPGKEPFVVPREENRYTGDEGKQV